MTVEQKNTILSLHEQYVKNCQENSFYDTSSYCNFSTLRNEKNSEDDNIVVIWVKIDGIDNYGIPQTQITNFLIEANGKFYEMDMMPDVFFDDNEIISYIQKLTKFNWNAQ